MSVKTPEELKKYILDGMRYFEDKVSSMQQRRYFLTDQWGMIRDDPEIPRMRQDLEDFKNRFVEDVYGILKNLKYDASFAKIDISDVDETYHQLMEA